MTAAFTLGASIVGGLVISCSVASILHGYRKARRS